ncbi:MAG: hypothetical protein KDD36_09130 [Flavobacteriales bacterium]|nr:hypothetical protein [Flavobacteriales bacterium]
MKNRILSILLLVIIIGMYSCGNSMPDEAQTNDANQDEALTDAGVVDQSEALAQFYEQGRADVQSFELDISKDQSVKANGGTELSIPAGALVFENGDPVSGSVTLKVQEFYAVADMLLGNLTTATDGKPLETAGMVHISATSDGKKLKVRDGAVLGLNMPASKVKSGMQLYQGKEDASGSVNWQLAQQPDQVSARATSIKKSVVKKKTPENYGGKALADLVNDRVFLTQPHCNDCASYLQKNISCGLKFDNLTYAKTAILKFDIGFDGTVDNPAIAKGLSDACDEEILGLFKKSGEWLPPIDKKFGNSSVRWGIEMKPGQGRVFARVLDNEKLSLSKELFAALKNYMADIENSDKVKESDQLPTEAPVRGYSFGLTTLGWYNCDQQYRWEQEGIPLARLRIKTGSAQNTNLVVAFKGRSTVLPSGERDQESFSFNSLPSGDEVLVFAVQIRKDGPYFAFRDATIGNEEELTLAFEKMSYIEVKEKMANAVTVGVKNK